MYRVSVVCTIPQMEEGEEAQFAR